MIVTFKNKEILLGVPVLEVSTGRAQYETAYVIGRMGSCRQSAAICCNTTSSNTDRRNGACRLLDLAEIYYTCYAISLRRSGYEGSFFWS